MDAWRSFSQELHYLLIQLLQDLDAILQPDRVNSFLPIIKKRAISYPYESEALPLGAGM